MQRKPLKAGAAAGTGAESGIALLAVVAVLVLLTIIATPFLVTMKDGADRGKALLASYEAGMEAENVIQVTTLHLGASHDALERKAFDDNRKGPSATPDWDTLDEFQIPSSVLAAAGGDPSNGRIWGVTVEDESGKINVNSAPFTTLGQFFGISQLASPLETDASEAELDSPGNLPARNGIVRIADEVMKYDRLEGARLTGLQRGYMAGSAPGNGPARQHAANTLVVSEVAFQISAYPILARRGKVDGLPRTWHVPFKNLYEMRRISDLGVAALSADEWERAADSLTVSSRGIAGHLFGDPQTLQVPVKAGEDGHKAILRLANPYRYGIGTIVRVSDGTNTDYAVVYGVEGDSQVEVVPELMHDYNADSTRVEALIRAPVNINTASREVLIAMHAGLTRHGQKPVARDQAKIIADRILRDRDGREANALLGQKEAPPGIRSLKEYKALLRKLVDEGQIQPEEATACELNSLNPMDSAPGRVAVGSVPVAFRSTDVFTITARAVVQDTAGRELGRREFRRVVDVSPQGPAVYEIGGQADLDENLRVVNAKHFATHPVNIAVPETGIYPPSRFSALFRSERWPSKDRKEANASVRYAPSRPVYGPELPQPEHYDTEDYTDGYYMESGEAPSFGTKEARVAIKGDDGMEPFSASLWFKPYWGGKRTAYIVDTGDAENEDRVSLFYDGDSRNLVLRVKDSSLQSIAAEIRYPFDQSTLTDDTWYHLLVSTSGSGPGQMSLLVDGVSRGNPTLLSYLTQSVDPSADLTTLAVEDASTFPSTGALLIRGSDGVEVMEYSSRSDTGFTIRRRFARYNRADTTDDTNKSTTRAFQPGDLVTLYGYSIPTASALPEGSGTLVGELGRMNVLCLVGPSNVNGMDEWPDQGGGGGGTTGGGGASLPAMVWGWRSDTIQLPYDQVAGWNGDDGSTAVKAFGTRGYAILTSCSGDGWFNDFNGGANPLLDAELVAYEVGGGSITIKRKPEATPHLAYSGGGASSSSRPATLDKVGSNQTLSFIPRHNYGETDEPFFKFLKQYNVNNGRIYADETVELDGLISILIPISVEVADGDEGMFLDPELDPTRRPLVQYAQIGVDGETEWVRFDDAVQINSVSDNLLLVRDRSARRTVALLRNWYGEQKVEITPNPDPDPDPDPPGGPGDEPPTPGDPPEDDGGGGDPDAPPTPPDPGSGGGEDDGPGGTPDTPPPPPDPGTGPGEDDGPGGDPDAPPTPGGDEPPGEDDGPGGDPDAPPLPPEDTDNPPEDDGGGGDPDAPPDEPPPPDDGGGEVPPDDGGTTDPDPTLPPDPTTGGGTGGTTGGAAGTVTTPWPLHRIARYLDMRSTATTNDPLDGSAAEPAVFVADIPVRSTHAAGSQVLPVFLVAFPGTEYDPGGNGVYDPESGLNDILTTPIGSTSGGGATAGGPAGGGTASDNLWKPGDTGDGTEPGSSNVDGRFMEPGPGEDDIVTVVQGGADPVKETQVVNWSFRQYGWNRAGTARRSWTFAAFKQPLTRTYEANSRTFTASDVNSYLQGKLGDKRTYTRLVKSPSGELPVKVAESIHIGADFRGGGFAAAMVDEVQFVSPRSSTSLATRSTWYSGAFAGPGSPGKAVGADETNISIHSAPGFAVQTYASGLREAGGLLRIGDELIGYSSFDASSQMFVSCERGALGTEARSHPYGEPIVPVFGIAAARLEEGLSENSADIPLSSAAGFPIWGGFVRIGDELLGYTRIDGNILKMPRAVNHEEAAWSTTAGSDLSKGLLRSRFGSSGGTHETQSMVYLQPHRYPDLAAESADNPELSWYTVSREVQGAIWKRVSWDQRIRNLNGIRVLVRFEGGPAWDHKNLVRLGTDPVPDSDKTGWIYEIRSPRDLNLINVQSDRIECRVYFTYDKGAWNMTEGNSSDSWKETPWLQAFRIEYTAPTGVVTTEDLR